MKCPQLERARAWLVANECFGTCSLLSSIYREPFGNAVADSCRAKIVIPAQTGIQCRQNWFSACAEMMLRRWPFGLSPPRMVFLLSIASMIFMKATSAQPFFISGYGEGISVSNLAADGSMEAPILVARQANASFFCLHPTLDILYAVTETMRNDKDHPAAVVAYRFDREALMLREVKELEMLNSQPVDGDIPCHVAIDSSGKAIVISNYINGSVVVFPIEEDGRIGPESCNIVHEIVEGKKASNAHCCAISPTDRWALVADLGLDRVFVYSLDAAAGKLTSGPMPHLILPAGSGPRHLSFHPNGNYVYIINESNLTMTSASWDEETGQLSEINTVSTLPPDTPTSGFSTAEVLVHPSGQFVFGSNRGHDSIVTMQVDNSDGSILRAYNQSTLGKTPRNFRLTPDGQMLLAENQNSHSIFSFKVDQDRGQLNPTGQSITVQSPACIRFITEGR